MEFWERYLVALLVVALMLGGFSVLGRSLQRLGRPKGGRRIEVLESVMLAPQASLHLVRVGSRCLLVGAARESVTALGDVPEEGVASS